MSSDQRLSVFSESLVIQMQRAEQLETDGQDDNARAISSEWDCGYGIDALFTHIDLFTH
jgi:hypothetical protein